MPCAMVHRESWFGLRDNRISLTGLEKACKETPDMDPELIRVADIVSI